MDVDDVFRTEYFAAKAGDAVLTKLDDGQVLGLAESRNLNRNDLWLHMNHIGRANHVADAAAGAFFDLDTFDHAILQQIL